MGALQQTIFRKVDVVTANVPNFMAKEIVLFKCLDYSVKFLIVDWIGRQISNMYNIGCEPTIMKLVVESTDLPLESANYYTNLAKIAVGEYRPLHVV